MSLHRLSHQLVEGDLYSSCYTVALQCSRRLPPVEVEQHGFCCWPGQPLNTQATMHAKSAPAAHSLG